MDTAQLITMAILAVAVLSLVGRLWVNNRKASNPHSDHELLVEIRDSLHVIHGDLVEMKIHIENIWDQVNK